MASVPQEILNFFERTKLGVQERPRPWWLQTDASENLWVVDIGKSDLREVNEKVRGGLLLSWDTLLPLGNLCDHAHERVRSECKALLIAVADMRGSTRALYDVLRTLLNFVEFLALKYERKLLAQGLSIAHIDDVEDFLEAHSNGGTCATGMFIERFEDCLREHGVSRSPRSMPALMRLFGAAGRGQLSFVGIGAAISVDWNRLRASDVFLSFLSQYGYANRRVSSPTVRTTTRCAEVLATLSEAAHAVPALRRWALGNVQLVRDTCRPYRGDVTGRTPTMPEPVFRRMVLKAASWMLNQAPALERCIGDLVTQAVELKGSNECFIRSLNLVEKNFPWKTLQGCADHVDGRHVRQDYHRTLPLSFSIIRIHLGVCYTLTSLLSCSRLTEVCDLSPDALFSVEGREFLTVEQAKRGSFNVRPSFDKPVPRIVGMAMASLERIKSQLLRLISVDDELTHHRAFFFVGLRGIRPFNKSDPGEVLRSMSAYFELEDETGMPWMVASHQLRRAFAMTFFHSEDAETALPALSWLMGHHSVEKTWRYVRETMTGKEISQAEAEMAMASVCSDDASSSALRLKDLLLRHFGCEDLAVLDRDEALEYLEMLAETDEIRVTPIQISTGDRRAFTVLVSFRSES